MKKSFSRKFKNTVMCHDPSMTAWGWAIVTPKGKVVANGCIVTEPSAAKLNIRKGDDRIRRIKEINFWLKKTIIRYSPDLHVCELPHGSQNAAAAVMVGAVAGVIETICFWLDVPIEYYSEADAKKAVSGKRSLSKDDMKRMIGKLFKPKWFGKKKEDEAVADSLAIFVAAKQSSEMLKFLTK